MSRSQNRSSQQLFSQAKGINSSISTGSMELQSKLNFMQKRIQDHSSFLNCGFCSRSNKDIDDAFKKAFKKLNLNEQVVLFWRMCKIKKQANIGKLQQLQQLFPHKTEGESSVLQMLDTTIYIMDKKQYKIWTVTRIKASLKTKKVVITDTSAIIDMHDYLIRNSKNKQRQCFALEATNLQQQFQTIKISNEGHSFEETLKFFNKMKRLALVDQICSLVNPKLLHKQNEIPLLENEKVVDVKISTKLGRRPSMMKMSSASTMDPNMMFQKMMTLKLVSPEYGKSSMKVVQKEMLQRERVIRLRDNSYNQIYKALLPPKLIQRLDDVSGDWENVMDSECWEVYYNRKEQKVKKIYRIKCSDVIIFDWIVDELNNFSNFKKWKPNMESITCLTVFPSEKSKVYHELQKNESKRINYVFVRHHFELPNNHIKNGKPRKIYYFYDQSIAAPIAKEYFGIKEPIAQISYILWKFYEVEDTITLIVQAKCDHFTTLQSNLKMTENYLGQFHLLKNYAANYPQQGEESDLILNTVLFENQYIQRIDEIQDIDHDTEYFTIHDSQSNKNNNTLLTKKFQQPLPQKLNKSMSKVQRRVSFEDMDTKGQQSLLKFRHPIVPYKKGPPSYFMPKTPGGHFHWEEEWLIKSNGDLINQNKQKIQAQNDVLKNVFKKLGRNLFSGKSILSISLPVDAFGTDSNLSRLCNSYGYAPRFLQQAAQSTDPIERFKKVISFAISSTVIYIRMDKPFNPILGETYQSLIDGCPVYGQQISHHPPISAVFVKGRGYTVYGHLQAKVEMSLNSASGINDGQIHVSFNHEDISKDFIKYTAPPGQLAGLVMGQRKMSLIKKSHYFDPENLIYCEVKWGKQKGKSQFSKNFNDAVQAQIVKLRPGFDPSKWKNVKKEDIVQEYGLINGRWTGAVYYGKDLLFDTYTMYPYKIQPYKALLESDVSKRKDLILRSTSLDMEPAQQAKQQLQEIQRNDRKLRAQYGHGH